MKLAECIFLKNYEKLEKFVTIIEWIFQVGEVQRIRLVSAWFFPVFFYSTYSEGAKEYNSCRAQKMKMLQNAPFLAIVAVDTDENEPSEVR